MGNKAAFFDDELAQEANGLLTAILYERIKVSDVKWNILGMRTEHLIKKLKNE